MSYELYEVWAEEDDGHQELIDTTRSLSHAIKLARNSINDGYVAGIVYQETEEGDTVEIERIEST
jgi:hypothetical protein